MWVGTKENWIHVKSCVWLVPTWAVSFAPVAPIYGQAGTEADGLDHIQQIGSMSYPISSECSELEPCLGSRERGQNLSPTSAMASRGKNRWCLGVVWNGCHLRSRWPSSLLVICHPEPLSCILGYRFPPWGAWPVCKHLTLNRNISS